MLPDAKKVARVLNKLFQSPEERREQRELDRDVQFRLGKARLRRHLNRQREMLTRLTSLAKRALSINDEARFQQVGRQLLWTRQDIQRWEQYLLSLDVLAARRDQARASMDLFHSIKTMSDSLSDLAAPQQLAELQRQMEEGLAHASSLEERMAVMMEMMDATLASDLQVDEPSLEDLEKQLSEQIAAQESARFDREIEEGLQTIREELNRAAR